MYILCVVICAAGRLRLTSSSVGTSKIFRKTGNIVATIYYSTVLNTYDPGCNTTRVARIFRGMKLRWQCLKAAMGRESARFVNLLQNACYRNLNDPLLRLNATFGPTRYS